MSLASVDQTDFVSVSVNMAPVAVPYQNFGTPLVLGDSGVIDVGQRVRTYTTIGQVLSDFGSSAPEYLAALIFFSQQPTPSRLMVGRWARTATGGLIHGASLSATQQAALLTSLQGISTGSFSISIDGTAHDVTGLNFSSILNLNGAASVIQTALDSVFTAPGIRCVWGASNSRFSIVSATTGSASSVGFAGTAASGVDVSALLGLVTGGGGALVPGLAAESPLAAVTACAGVSSAWYCATFAASVMPTDSDHEAVASYILASSRTRIYAVTIQNTACLDPTQTSDLASVIKGMNNKRVFWQYSSSNPYAAISLFGREATVNYDGSYTAITLAWKQEPGVSGEDLTETQFSTLQAKGGNVNININNGATMIWPGQMSNGYWCDEVQGLDWLVNRIQTDLFNLFYGTQTKIPQTDPGLHQIKTEIESSLQQGVNSGFLAPGVWNASGFGQLNQGDMLSKGFYVYVPAVSSQSQTDRDARVSPPFQCAVKLAGAVHTANVIIGVNR